MTNAVWDTRMTDYWTTRATPHESWVANSPVDVLNNGLPLVDLKVRGNGYNVEIDDNSITHSLVIDPTIIVDATHDIPFYKEFLAETLHENYVAVEDDSPYIVSIEVPTVAKENVCKKILIRSKQEEVRIVLPSQEKVSYLAQQILQLRGPLLKVKNPAIVKELVQYEAKNIISCYKFGVLYCKPFQTLENDIFSNQATSPQYGEFLEFLGEKITLQGWPKFRAGLDVRDNTTGTHSVYTTFRSYEIMFHVSTLLPFQVDDPQRIEKKRHTGNDVVVIVFKERGDDMDTFNPTVLTSHFNHCFFIVQAEGEENGKTTHYRLTVANKEGVFPYPPFLPHSPVFPKSSEFREFLLQKLINAERTAMWSKELW